MFGGDGEDFDLMSGGAGDDWINATASETGLNTPSDTVRCGSGTNDLVYANNNDIVADNCEWVNPPE